MQASIQVVFVGTEDPDGACQRIGDALNTYSTKYRSKYLVGDATSVQQGAFAPAEQGERILVHACDDYSSLRTFLKVVDHCAPHALVARHPAGPYRFEAPRAGRIDDEIGFTLRLIEPSLFTDQPAARPLLPPASLSDSELTLERDRVVIGHRPGLSTQPALAQTCRAIASQRTNVEWRPGTVAGCDLYVDHLDRKLGGFSVSAIDAMGSGAIAIGAYQVGPAVDLHWPRPPLVVANDAAGLATALISLIENPQRRRRQQQACWAWARDVASPAAVCARFEHWLEEAMANARLKERPTRLWSPTTAAPEVGCAVIARADDPLQRASLRASLRSVSSVTDECVVVLDDRSPSETAAELRELGAHVVRRRWTNDFAAARNAVHPHVKAQWLVLIDSDEVLVRSGDLARAIESARDGGHQAVLARVRAVDGDGGSELLWQFRAYDRNTCHWMYPVHNELFGMESVVPTTALFHASYVGTATEKAARSLPLLHEQEGANPTEPRWAHFLAQTYSAIGDTSNTVRWAERCIALAPDDEAYVHRWIDVTLAQLAAQKPEQALRTVHDAVQRHPTHPDPWHTLATVALARWFEASMAHRRTPSPTAVIRTADRASKLPSVATELGLPLALGPRADAEEPSSNDHGARAEPGHEPTPSDRSSSVKPALSAAASSLRIAVVCGPDTKFIAPIEHELRERYEVRALHFSQQARLGDIANAMQWADVTWFEWCDELLIESSRRLPKTSRVICRLHSREVFEGHPRHVDWGFVDHLVLVAPYMDRLVRREFDPNVPSSAIPNLVDVDRFTMSPTHSEFSLAFVGNLNFKKNPELLLQCMANLVAADARYRLDIAGEFQDLRYRLYFERMIPALGLQEAVRLHGWVDDINGWLEGKGFVVSTSVLESFGVGLAEAMAKGLTPIVHNWPGAEELFDAEHIFNTPAEFTQRVRRGTTDPQRLRDHIGKRYSKAAVMAAIEKLLAEVVA